MTRCGGKSYTGAAKNHTFGKKNYLALDFATPDCNLSAPGASKNIMRKNLNDRESVRRVLYGDVEEFSRLVGQHVPRMLNLALGIVRRRDAAEDVVQDSLVKAYEKLGSWRGDSALSTWLYRIVYTTALSALRSRHDFFDTAPEPPYAEADDDDSWELTENNIVRMRRSLEELPPLDRTLVNLFYLEERSVREVAAICGESETNVKTRLHRARSRLRRLMEI